MVPEAKVLRAARDAARARTGEEDTKLTTSAERVDLHDLASTEELRVELVETFCEAADL